MLFYSSVSGARMIEEAEMTDGVGTIGVEMIGGAEVTAGAGIVTGLQGARFRWVQMGSDV
jgi:hypothetical protein